MIDNLIFALDIGTRSVIGIIGFQENEFFRVVDMEMIAHNQRAMIDGQIEDILEVAKVIKTVKERLEMRQNLQLTQAYVAAAGRTLKTCTARYELAVSPGEPIKFQDVANLEIGAVDEACRIIVEHNEQDFDYYCVGYSVSQYELDGYKVKNLLEHQGRKIGIEIIATFLPQHVVESLYAAVQKAGLQVASLTLEPLAAMNAIIPEELRLLNLALVDIGAGTTDIAISNEGHICAYSMAAVAGDEITEAILKALLLDFNTAEELKIKASQGVDPLTYQDILGVEYSISSVELSSIIAPAVNNLADVICERLIEINGQPPAAIFLVGGGSQVPELADMIAAKLSIDPKKVAVGSNNYLKRVVVGELDIKGPQFATPLGIALTAVMKQGKDYFSVYVNDRPVRMYNKNQVTVMEALLMSGYQHHQIMAPSGRNLIYEINGERKIQRGSPAMPAEIILNDKSASLLNPVQAGDKLYFTPAKPGRDASLTVREALAQYAEGKYLQEDMSNIEIYLNGSPAGLDDSVSSRGCLLVVAKEKPAVKDEAGSRESERRVDASQTEEEKINNNGVELNLLLNDRPLRLQKKADGSPYLFVDLLNFVDIDLSKPQGNIVLKRNGHSASYIEILEEGDVIQIYWEQKN